MSATTRRLDQGCGEPIDRPSTWTREVDSGRVDPFAVVIFSGIAALVLCVWLIGRYFPGSGLEQLGMKTAREISETRERPQ